jgi:hypothetical protein
MTLSDCLQEIREAERAYWFVQGLAEIEQTDEVLKARLEIQAGLFVHVFFSEASGRFQLALVKNSQRLYGRDCEDGLWHLHPYGTVDQHLPTPGEVGPRPIMQFMREVEQLLLENELF